MKTSRLSWEHSKRNQQLEDGELKFWQFILISLLFAVTQSQDYSRWINFSLISYSCIVIPILQTAERYFERASGYAWWTSCCTVYIVKLEVIPKNCSALNGDIQQIRSQLLLVRRLSHSVINPSCIFRAKSWEFLWTSKTMSVLPAVVKPKPDTDYVSNASNYLGLGQFYKGVIMTLFHVYKPTCNSSLFMLLEIPTFMHKCLSCKNVSF